MMRKTLGEMNKGELKSLIGKKILARELGGTILISTVLGLTFDDDRLVSLKVDEGNNEVTIWPTQWRNAVMA